MQTYKSNEFIYTSTYCCDPAIDNILEDKNIIISMCKFAEEMSIDFIKKVVCDYFDLTLGMLQSNTRKREIVKARQIAMYFTRLRTKKSFSEIGRELGNKHHSTCLWSIKQVYNELGTNKMFALQLKDIERLLK